jgi:RNA polymerase sigma-70 factor (ECF subfamily)
VLTSYSEIEIIAGCKKGNRVHQKALYDKYKDAMFTICKRIVCDEDLACDALQEGFLEVFRGIDSFQGNSTLGAWVKTILIRKSILLGKRFKMMDEITEIHHDQVIEWDANLTGRELELAIHELPQGYRNVFLLIEVEGYTHRETAELLGISEGTSKSQLFHSKKMLQQRLISLRN